MILRVTASWIWLLKVSNQGAVFTALQLNEVFGETVKLTITGNLMEEFGGTPIKGEDCMSVLNKRSQIYGKVIDINTLDCEERAAIAGLKIPQGSIKVSIDHCHQGNLFSHRRFAARSSALKP